MILPASPSLADIQQSFRSLNQDLRWVLNGALDWKGRTHKNAGKAAVATDLLPLGQAQGLFAGIEHTHPDLLRLINSISTANVRMDVFANRGTATKGRIFVATDMNYVAWVGDGIYWRYLSGIYPRTQAQIAAVSALLLPTDEGFLIHVTDYEHILKWTSAPAWTWGPGDMGSRVVVASATSSAPVNGLWGACDGTSYNCLNAGGTVSSVATQNLTGGVFLMGDTAAGSQVAAARATWEATAKTDNESAHTHAVGTLANANAATGVTVNNAATGISIDAHTTSTEVIAGASTVLTGPASHTVTDPQHNHGVTDPQHTHTISGSTAAGSAHSHNLSNANAQLKVFSEANGGLPLRIAAVWWMRR